MYVQSCLGTTCLVSGISIIISSNSNLSYYYYHYHQSYNEEFEISQKGGQSFMGNRRKELNWDPGRLSRSGTQAGS